ncbi:acetyltransferase [Christiangramia echinicola]|uniref:acetyltransferase n=1 Tax=Christiangramia echinicola TaxID=279359 RepID=UPI0004034F5B|nr:acetyltransferase [Christiangramia echinicola]
MIIYGASGHAKVIIDIIKSLPNHSIDLVIDDNPAINKLLDYEVEHELLDISPDREVVLAIGKNMIRYNLAGKLNIKFCSPLIHSSAIVSDSSMLGNGSVVMAQAVINSSAEIGEHCIINSGAMVEHDVYINDFVHISPGAIITGNVKIGTGTHVGAGATIIPGIEVGKWVTIGAGAVVIENIPDFAVVVGNPAKVVKFNKIGDE